MDQHGDLAGTVGAGTAGDLAGVGIHGTDQAGADGMVQAGAELAGMVAITTVGMEIIMEIVM